ncbi:SDR family NAD(P)-dependent oxidoreductase [Candidatus Spongiihabitans sp.]|uniref:SDR family NAD(P)-dependent oxidoreductase n=1 Tax=Candidatus Spongiihabitans sp. TaxID=3101308 RepID=UPI003C7B627D
MSINMTAATAATTAKMLRGKTAIITGAARGIGYACAQRFIKEGARVVLADVDDAAGTDAVNELRDEYDDVGNSAAISYAHCDVSVKAEVEALFDFALDKYNRVDTVIANAGIVHTADILELEESDFDRVIAVNLKGVFLTGQIAAQRMIKQQPDADGSRGTIINMSSLNGVLAIPAIAPYVIAKGGVNQWTKCLGIRMASEGVRVNGIGPGSINTEMFRSIADNPQKMKEVMSRTPMQRPGEPDEVAKVAVFLASHYSSYMTGETVYADGGRQGLNYVVPVKEEL